MFVVVVVVVIVIFLMKPCNNCNSDVQTELTSQVVVGVSFFFNSYILYFPVRVQSATFTN